MLYKAGLLLVLSSLGVTQRDKLIAILASVDETPLPTAAIKAIALDSGFREIDKWNISTILGNAKGLVLKGNEGWYLTLRGQQYAVELSKSLQNPTSTKHISTDLRSLLTDINNSDTRAFIEEAIKCLESDAFRAAIVFSWVGAISILYDHIILKRLNDFNLEAKRRDARWKTAITRDDLALLKESEFLDILVALSIIGKNVKEHLKNVNLNDRNSCGHPSSVIIGKHTVESHIEYLVNNIYKRF